MRIAVISDTHNLLRPEVIEQVRLCDAVIHAGDVCRPELVEQLREKLAGRRLYLVRGNNDGNWATDIPEMLSLKLEQTKILVIHDRSMLPEDLQDHRIIIYGHSHRYAAEEKDGRLWLNPGSCGYQRFWQEVSMAILYLEPGIWHAEKILLVPKGTKTPAPADNTSAAGQKRLFGLAAKKHSPARSLPEQIEEILRRMDRGQSTRRISSRMGLEEAFVEEICRIRVTHPGVTAGGIADKLEANRSLSRQYKS